MLLEELFEARIIDIDPINATCTLNPLNGRKDALIQDVPLPYMAGSGNVGLFIGFTTGTRVIAGRVGLNGPEAVVILSIMPNKNQVDGNTLPRDTPGGILKYPLIKHGTILLRSSSGSEVDINENGDIRLETISKNGLFIKKNQNGSIIYMISPDIVNYSNSGKNFQGNLKRRNLFLLKDSDNFLFADTDYHNDSKNLGFFTGSKPTKIPLLGYKRNPSLSEYRTVINEFSTDSIFTGFDEELDRIANKRKLFELTGDIERDRKFRRTKQPGNTLYLAENELIEFIAGNLVDISGKILDLNFTPITYGGPNITVPSENFDARFDEAKRKSRRGVGLHLQLSTNTSSSDSSNSQNNFIFDVDKEGVIKVNIPKSSQTGNIPFVSSTDFAKDSIENATKYSNPSWDEPIPVTLRDSDGKIVFPKTAPKTITRDTRATGIRYSNDDSNPYFPSTTQELTNPIRINPTKHHNMYAAAERLIANTIKAINIPITYVADGGLPDELSNFKPFEVPPIDEYNGEVKPKYAVVQVSPGEPAIYTGGDVVVAGKLQDDKMAKLSNSFESVVDSSGKLEPQILSPDGLKRLPTGGVSANINLEGSLELSVGKDVVDEKSIMLDTAGSIISWLGKDKNNRSLIAQTDGDVLINIGGSYNKPSFAGEEPSMNIGRLDLRVNVVDKKFVASNDGSNVGPDSDYIISISEEGLVIAGLHSNKPMVFKNDGPIIMESASQNIILKGTQVKIVEAGRPARSTKSPLAKNQ